MPGWLNKLDDTKLLAYISVFFSIVSVLIAIFVRKDWTLAVVVISYTVVFVFLLLLALYLIRRRDSDVKKLHGKKTGLLEVVRKQKEELDLLRQRNEDNNFILKKVAFNVYNICEKQRNVMNNIYNRLVTKDANQASQTKGDFKTYIAEFLADVKAIFDCLTKHECSVCIKLALKRPDDHGIKIFKRDWNSSRRRGGIDKTFPSYSHREDTAFLRIISQDYEGVDLFVCDNLKALALQKTENYINHNPAWRDYYNACLVVPIRAEEKQLPDVPKAGGGSERLQGEARKIVYYDYAGFLCVDNEEGGFDNEVTRNVLAALGDISYLLFRMFRDMNRMDKYK